MRVASGGVSRTARSYSSAAAGGAPRASARLAAVSRALATASSGPVAASAMCLARSSGSLTRSPARVWSSRRTGGFDRRVGARREQRMGEVDAPVAQSAHDVRALRLVQCGPAGAGDGLDQVHRGLGYRGGCRKGSSSESGDSAPSRAPTSASRATGSRSPGSKRSVPRAAPARARGRRTGCRQRGRGAGARRVATGDSRAAPGGRAAVAPKLSGGSSRRSVSSARSSPSGTGWSPSVRHAARTPIRPRGAKPSRGEAQHELGWRVEPLDIVHRNEQERSVLGQHPISTPSSASATLCWSGVSAVMLRRAAGPPGGRGGVATGGPRWRRGVFRQQVAKGRVGEARLGLGRPRSQGAKPLPSGPLPRRPPKPRSCRRRPRPRRPRARALLRDLEEELHALELFPLPTSSPLHDPHRRGYPRQRGPAMLRASRGRLGTRRS